mmetsp:Transcript_46443/g.132401  ORF Transcript_46443/g.132401 Transcript_46443/m.132401 type:complete len:311 (-) Transcript_46443:826-1758(-)
MTRGVLPVQGARLRGRRGFLGALALDPVRKRLPVHLNLVLARQPGAASRVGVPVHLPGVHPPEDALGAPGDLPAGAVADGRGGAHAVAVAGPEPRARKPYRWPVGRCWQLARQAGHPCLHLRMRAVGVQQSCLPAHHSVGHHDQLSVLGPRGRVHGAVGPERVRAVRLQEVAHHPLSRRWRPQRGRGLHSRWHPLQLCNRLPRILPSHDPVSFRHLQVTRRVPLCPLPQDGPAIEVHTKVAVEPRHLGGGGPHDHCLPSLVWVGRLLLQDLKVLRRGSDFALLIEVDPDGRVVDAAHDADAACRHLLARP